MLNFYNPVNVRKPTFFQRFQGGGGVYKWSIRLKVKRLWKDSAMLPVFCAFTLKLTGIILK